MGWYFFDDIIINSKWPPNLIMAIDIFRCAVLQTIRKSLKQSKFTGNCTLSFFEISSGKIGGQGHKITTAM